MSDEDWDFSFDLNVKSMHRTLRAFLPGMLKSGRGSIVNVSSAAGVFKAAPNRYVYGATKAAVAALTRAVAVDFITKGIRCNCICPGTIETPSMLNRAAAAGPEAARCSSAGNRWDGSAPPTKSPHSRSISPATKARSRQASRISSTAAGRFNYEPHPRTSAFALARRSTRLMSRLEGREARLSWFETRKSALLTMRINK